MVNEKYGLLPTLSIGRQDVDNSLLNRLGALR
jgi:hypothetical protein